MSPLKSPFRATIDASLKGLSELAPVLREEQAALTGNDAEALENIVANKIALLKELEHSVMAREQILGQAQCGSGLEGSEQFIREHFSPQEILQDWQRLKELSKEVDELNTHNAKLAFAGEHTTRQALGILTGRSQEAETYSKRRDTKGPAEGISLGKC
jgi:flagellar biosynthesis/type III secretory pathway chaperone